MKELTVRELIGLLRKNGLLIVGKSKSSNRYILAIGGAPIFAQERGNASASHRWNGSGPGRAGAEDRERGNSSGDSAGMAALITLKDHEDTLLLPSSALPSDDRARDGRRERLGDEVARAVAHFDPKPARPTRRDFDKLSDDLAAQIAAQADAAEAAFQARNHPSEPRKRDYGP